MVEALGLSLTQFIFYLINFLILVGILGKFLYRPFLDMLAKRKQTIQDALDNAAMTNAKADQKLENYEKKIANYEAEGREIIRKSKAKADDQAKRIIEDANNRAGELIVKAEKEIERERASALADMKKEVASMALLAAGKILERELSGDEEQMRIVDQVIEEAGK
ncbi:MAG: F0F1 ATP synthase subunit B [Anaerovoracaceae bacterium]|nr:F0F1 ATP synthase subunit B [Anaerovoracaceae bacterium]